MSSISKAIAKANSLEATHEKKDSNTKQMEAAEFYGVISTDPKAGEPPRKRGRPRNVSKSPAPPPQKPNSQKATDENVNNAVEEMKKNSLITKVKAYAAYWPDLCSESLKSINIHTCSVEQLALICKGFEDTVNLDSEIIDIPSTFKKAIGRLEPIGLGIGYSNLDHPILREFTKLHGFGAAIERDPAVDKNIKLLAIRFLGKMPRNPYVNLVISVVMCAFEVFKENSTYSVEPASEIENENYKDL